MQDAHFLFIYLLVCLFFKQHIPINAQLQEFITLQLPKYHIRKSDFIRKVEGASYIDFVQCTVSIILHI